MATTLVSRLALRGHGLGLLVGGRVASAAAARPLHASAAVAGKHVWYPDVDTVSVRVNKLVFLVRFCPNHKTSHHIYMGLWSHSSFLVYKVERDFRCDSTATSRSSTPTLT